MDSQSLRSDSSLEFEPRRTLPSYLQCLSASQAASLAELKGLCATQRLYWHAGKDGKKPSNDDVTLLRYLRARDYKVHAAFKQYNATVTWRHKLKLDELYLNADITHFETTSRLFPLWTGRRSRAGVPLFAYRIPKISPQDLLASTKSDPNLTSVFLPAEYSAQLVQPLCARLHPDGVMPCLMHIIDLSGVGVKHFWNLRAHLQKLSTMATSHYPEAVDKIFILGAPSFFPTIWGYINKWFEPNLTSKISVLSSTDAYTTLVKHIHPDDIPVFAGGSLDWDYGMQPIIDEDLSRLVGRLATDWVDGPLKLVQDDQGDKIISAGSSAGQKRSELLVTLPGHRAIDDSDEGEA